MKNSRLELIALLFIFGMIMILNSCQKDETSNENQTQIVSSKSSTKGKKTKIDVCHNNHIINISSNAVSAHQRHGDAVDMDGDGYFDIDNSCSETDCNDNDPEINSGAGETYDLSTAELLIGSWTTSEIFISTSVGAQSLYEYLISEVGLSPEDAIAQVGLYEAELEEQVTGTLIIYSDNTYDSFFDGGTDNGTWSLSEDEKTLTLFEGADTINININSISGCLWNSSTSDEFLQDLDGDPDTSEVAVMAEANVIFIR